jgi:hypothetical protein
MLQDKKTEKYEGLRFLNVLYVDASETSPQLFQITDFPKILTAGRNLFKLKGHPENLNVGSFVNIEILDSNGNPIYHEILDYIEEDKSRVVAIYIYDHTPPGDALITIVGTAKTIEGQQVPIDWKDQINVKWEKFVTVNPTLQNNSEIIYVSKRDPERLFEEIQVPQIQVTEQIITYLDREYIDGSQFKTYDTGSVTYSFSNNTAIITLTGGVFNQDMEGGTFTCTSPINAKPKPLDATGTGGTKTINTSDKAAPSTGANPTKTIVPKEESPTGEATIEFVPITRTYTSKIKKVLSATTIELETPYQVSFVGSNATHTYTSFESSSYTISYEGDPEYISTPNSESFANIVINDLEPATGDTTYINVYYKSKGAPAGDYNFLNEVEVGYTELLVDSSSLNPDTRIGRIKSQNTIDNYWEASYYEGTTIAGTPTLTFETSSIINAISVGRISGKSLDSINNVTVLQNKDAYTETRIGAQTRHKITFDAYSQKNSNDTKYPVMHVYLSGSAFDFDSGDIYNQNYPKRFGKRIATLRAIGNTQKFYEQEYEPVSDNSGSASILFVIETGDWSVSNIRMQTNNDAGYTPNTFAFRTQMPKTHKIGNQLDFKFEYYTANKQRSKQVTFVEATQNWEGGNLYIDGGSNLLTGSVYIGNAIGSGIELAGVASGYIRSLGYNGYLAATQGSGSGFIIYSGSSDLTLGSVSDGTIQSYTGIGLELVSPNDTSHLIFQTKNGGLLDIKTEKFFIGTTGSQFISGSDGDIEISSSLFHLDPKNNLLVIGTDAVINADLSVDQIFTPATIGGSPSNETNASSSIKSDGFARFVSASIGGFNISETQIFSTNENIILKSSGEITASQGFLFGDKTSSQYIQWDAGSLVVRGDLSVDRIFTPALIGGSPANITNASSSITSDGFAKFVSASIGGWSVDTGSIQGSNIIMLPEGTIQTKDFATNVKGWKISSLGNGTAEFENVRIRGTLKTAVFEKETVNAVGGQLYVANSTTISGSADIIYNATASISGRWFPSETGVILINESRWKDRIFNVDIPHFTSYTSGSLELYDTTGLLTGSINPNVKYEYTSSAQVGYGSLIVTSSDARGVVFSDNSVIRSREYMTIVVWAKPYELNDNGSAAGIIWKNSGYGIRISTANYQFYGYDTIPKPTSGGTPVIDEWVHLVLVRSGSSITGYQNGAQVATRSDLSSLGDDTGTNLNLGYQTTNNSFAGEIGHVSMYDIPFTATEVSESYDALRNRYTDTPTYINVLSSNPSQSLLTVDRPVLAKDSWFYYSGSLIETTYYPRVSATAFSSSYDVTGSIPATAEIFYVDNASGFAIGEILKAKKVSNTGFATEYLKVTDSFITNPSSDTDLSGFIHVDRAYGKAELEALAPEDQVFLTDLVSLRQSYEEGQVIVSTGLIGSGYIHLNANPRDQSTPYMDIVERTGSGVYDTALKVRLGDLSGLANSTYVFGNPNPGFGLATDNVFLQGGIIANTGSIGGINMDAGKLYTGVGTWGDANTGFYVDSESSMSLSNKLRWDGTQLTISGVINIESGTGFATQANINTATGSLSSSIATSITTVSSSFSSSLSGVSGSIVNTVSTVSGSIVNTISTVSGSIATSLTEFANSIYIDFNESLGLDSDRWSTIGTIAVSGSSDGISLSKTGGANWSALAYTNQKFYRKNAPVIELDLKHEASAGGNMYGIVDGPNATPTLSQVKYALYIINTNLYIRTYANDGYEDSIAIPYGTYVRARWTIKPSGGALLDIFFNGNLDTPVLSFDYTSGTETEFNIGSIILNSSYSTKMLQLAAGGGSLSTGQIVSQKIVTDINNKITKPNPTPSGDGLFLASSHMGYYDNSDWNAYISSSGEFLFKADNDNLISFGNNSFVLKVSDQAVISGSQISLLTPNFFFGGTNQFISGANSNIEISSSNFHLQPNGDVVIGGGATIAGDILAGAGGVLPTNENLKIYLNFEEATGTAVFNMANPDQDFTINSTSYERVSGSAAIAAGNALYLDGSYLTADSGDFASTIIHDGDSMVSQSINLWLRPIDASTSTPEVIYEQDGGINGQVLYIANNNIYWSIFRSSALNSADRAVVSCSIDNTRTAIGVYLDYDNDEIAIYKNGLLQQSLTKAGLNPIGSDLIGIGAVAGNSRVGVLHNNAGTSATTGQNPFNGYIDEVRVYKRILTDDEFNGLYKTPAGSPSTTKITGDNISTGQIKSNNLSATQGTLIDLNGEVFKIGGTSVTPTSGEGIVLDGSVTGQPKFFVGDASEAFVRFGETAGKLEVSSSGFSLDTTGAVTATELLVRSGSETMIDTSTGFADARNIARTIPITGTGQFIYHYMMPGERYIVAIARSSAGSGVLSINFSYLDGNSSGAAVSDSGSFSAITVGTAVRHIAEIKTFGPPLTEYGFEGSLGEISISGTGINTGNVTVFAVRNIGLGASKEDNSGIIDCTPI